MRIINSSLAAATAAASAAAAATTPAAAGGGGGVGVGRPITTVSPVQTIPRYEEARTDEDEIFVLHRRKTISKYR